MHTSRKNLLAAVSGYVLALVFLLFIATPLQMRYGMVGLLWTELGLLALAVLGTAVFRAPWRQVFNFHRPTVKGVFGTLLLWMGAYTLVMLVSMFTMLIAPPADDRCEQLHHRSVYPGAPGCAVPAGGGNPRLL